MNKVLKLQLYKTRLYLLENKGFEKNKSIIGKLKRRIANLENRI